MMKIARNRYQKSPSKDIDLSAIVNGGNNEGLEVAGQGPTFYLSSEDVKAIGGPGSVEVVEHELIGSLMKRGWFFWDRHRRLRKLLSLEQDEFLESVRKMFASKLSKEAGRKIELKPLWVDSIDVTIYHKRELQGGGFDVLAKSLRGFRTTRLYRWSGKLQDFNGNTFQELVEHDFEVKQQPEKVGSVEWTKFEDVDFTKDALPDFLRSLEQNKAVDIALDDIFVQRDGQHGTHAVSLMGTFFDGAEPSLKGFKYVNSWSTNAMAKGFGFITRDLLESYFEIGLIVRAVNLAPPQEAP